MYMMFRIPARVMTTAAKLEPIAVPRKMPELFRLRTKMKAQVNRV
jgi:hypothetical protein